MVAEQAWRLTPGERWSLALLRDADLLAHHARAARERYAAAYPELFVDGQPKVNDMNFRVAIDLALVLRQIGEQKRADQLLEGSRQVVARYPRMGEYGYGISDAQISAIRGDTAQALTAVRNAERAGWRGPFWRYYRDFDPALASIRNEPQFKAIFADIEHDMARQRAEFAARPKDAELELQKR
jgi:hypothetical protein